MNTLVDYLTACIKPINETEFVQSDSFDPNLYAHLKQDGIMICNTPCPPYLSFCERIKIGDKYFIKKCYRALDWLEKDGSFHFDESNVPIYRRLLPPPDETVYYTLIIKSIIEMSQPQDKTYIEYGVRWGNNLKIISPLVKQSYGIDNQDPPEVPSNCQFHRCLTDEFSTQTLPELTYHFAFIDADHQFKSCFQDFQHLYNYLQPGGYIFLHDTYPCAERLLAPSACNDCYKTPLAIKEHYPGIEMFTFPLNPGLTVVHKK